MSYYQKLEWSDNATTEERFKAIYNVLNFISEEISIGRVPNNKAELDEKIDTKTQDNSNAIDEILMILPTLSDALIETVAPREEASGDAR